MSMRPVKPPQALAGNPGASRCVRGHRRHRRRDRAGDGVGATAGTARRGPAGLARSTGIGLRCGAEQRRVPGAGTAGHSSGCHGRSGCTTRPGHGTVRTGTGGPDDPCAPRRTEGAGRKRPKRATLLWHRLHRHGVGRGTVVRLPGKSGRHRAHLLRHECCCIPNASSKPPILRVQLWTHPRRLISLPRAGAPVPTSPAPGWPPCGAASQARTPLHKTDQPESNRYLTSE